MLIRNSGAGSVPLVNASHDVHQPAANTDATKTILAFELHRHVLHKIVWSYSAAPTGGKITVTGSGKSLILDIPAGGPGAISITYVCAPNTALVVTLAAGGGTVEGKVYFEYTTEVA